MKLLLDANISWRLVPKLKAFYTDCFHVDHIELSVPASDILIWNYANDNDLIIVTNDDDFLNLVNLKGFPPKVILLRTGNQSNDFIEQLLIKHIADIGNFKNAVDIGLLEIY
jgi:predicted nuclease of predicted toxin-antitoxin system